jgi:hypothetical protein
MRFTSLNVLLAVLAPLASAYPGHIIELLKSDPELAARAVEILERQTGADSATAVFEPIPVFDASTQYIDVSPGSGHEWVAPGPSDNRGPCPGSMPRSL